jgi:lysophospholipase L1-like esterase
MAEQGTLFDSMDDISAWNTTKWSEKMHAEVDSSPHEGKSAIRITAKKDFVYGIFFRTFTADASWNDHAGISFRVKGDGSRNWGEVRLEKDGPETAWIATFPLSNTRWEQVKLMWSDFVPWATTCPELGSREGYRPGNVNTIDFGKLWNFDTRHEMPEISFSIDDIRIEGKLPSRRPRTPLTRFPSLSHVVDKMESGRRVTILSLGDSISWGAEAGGNDFAYPALVARELRALYGNEKIAVVNRAIGGSTTIKGREWLWRDIPGVEADLITVMFGYNEKAPPDRRQEFSRCYRENLVAYLEEVAGCMKEPPACLLLAPVPGRDAHWEWLDCYANVVRDLGREFPNLAVADANADIKALGQPAWARLMADEAHPNAEGQKRIARTVFSALTGRAMPGETPG